VFKNIYKQLNIKNNMEKDIGKIRKNDNTDIVIRVDDFGGRTGVTIREFTTSERYTGFTKSGTRIPADSFSDFKAMINMITADDLKTAEGAEKSGPEEKESEESQELL